MHFSDRSVLQGPMICRVEGRGTKGDEGKGAAKQESTITFCDGLIGMKGRELISFLRSRSKEIPLATLPISYPRLVKAREDGMKICSSLVGTPMSSISVLNPT